VPFWRKEKEEDQESQSERLRKFRNMYATQYGSGEKPSGPVKEVGEPVKVQQLCTICSGAMEADPSGKLACPAERAEPVLHDHLRVALQNWRSGQVQGKVVPHYNKTIGLMRQALKNALERDRDTRRAAAAGPTPGGLPPPVTSSSQPQE
jgi:hypothetical protein